MKREILIVGLFLVVVSASIGAVNAVYLVSSSESTNSEGDSIIFDKGKLDNPYIYVKETATGPRRFETWVTNGPVLPDGSDLVLDGTMLWSDCSDLLAGRPIEDVQIIIEAWVHQQPKRVINPNYDKP